MSRKAEAASRSVHLMQAPAHKKAPVHKSWEISPDEVPPQSVFRVPLGWRWHWRPPHPRFPSPTGLVYQVKEVSRKAEAAIVLKASDTQRLSRPRSSVLATTGSKQREKPKRQKAEAPLPTADAFGDPALYGVHALKKALAK